MERRWRTKVSRAGLATVLTLGLTGIGTGLVAPTAASAKGCRPTVVAGDQTIVVDDATVPLYLPAGFTGQRLPLVLDLHGSSSSGLQEMAGDGIRAVADVKKFAVVAPNGAIPFSPAPQFVGWAWNIPGVPLVGTTTYPAPGTRDDVQFLSHVIDAVASAACIDTKRVYATGISGGARMASQLACDLSDKIAAIAPIAGVRFPMATDTPPNTVDCPTRRSVPVIAIHGAWDPVNVLSDTPPAAAATLPAKVGTPVPGSSWSYSAETAVARWAAHNGCRPTPRVTAVSANIDVISYKGCHQNGDVVLYKLKNSGHGSPGHPGTTPPAFINPISTEVDGTVVAWDFLSQYRLNERGCDRD